MQTEAQPTRTRILNAAREIFSENGFHSASMKAICKSCAISPGTLYHHFISKEALIQAIILQDQERALARFREPIKGIHFVDYMVESIVSLTHEAFGQRALVVSRIWSKVPPYRFQRVQEDTMRFASTLENMGVSFINAIMTLIAFLPVLVTLSAHVPELPIVGHIPYGLVIAAIVWSLMGTGLLAVVGIKLPGLEFKNQRVEAAYRKELVYGEDDATRATPPTVRELFSAVRKNYFRLYFHYMYFNIARILYLQVDRKSTRLNSSH